MSRTLTPSCAFWASWVASCQPVESSLKMKVWTSIDPVAASISFERSANEWTPSKSGVTVLPCLTAEPVALSR